MIVKSTMLTFLLLAFCHLFSQSTQFFVDPIKGNDKNKGTIENPFKSILQAQEAVRALHDQSKGNIEVILGSGEYFLSKALQFGVKDGGANGNSVIYKAYQNETPVITGGKQITGWKKVTGENYYVADVSVKAGFASYFRQIWVNGRRVQQAKSDFIHHYPVPYDDPNTPEVWDGYIVKARDVNDYENIKDIRVFQEGDFKHVEQFVNKIVPISDSEKAIVMKQPDFYEWTKTYVYNTNNQIRIINAFEALDEPGEFYLNQKTQQIFYYPQLGENITTSTIVAPVSNLMVQIKGTKEAKVEHLEFQGITFQYGNWLVPNTKEFGRSQADLYPNYQAIEGQISLFATNEINFKKCKFLHLASAAIYLESYNTNTLIEGNLFKDLTATAVLVGKDMAMNESVNANTTISNNVIRSTGADFYQASGIYANSSKNLSIIHNDVSDVAYFGINQRYYIGKGIEPPAEFVGNTQVLYNKVSNFCTAIKHGFGIGDEVAAIYFFGVRDSRVRNNYVTNGGRNEKIEGVYRQDQYGFNNVWEYNVADAKSAKRSFSHYFNLNNNILFNFNFANAELEPYKGKKVATYNHFFLEKNAPVWSEAAQKIIDSAGVEPQYAYLLNEVNTGENIAIKAKIVSSDSKTSKEAFKLLDGQVETSYTVPNSGKQQAWVQLSLDKLYAIDKLQLVPVFNNSLPTERANFQVLLSNDAGFKNYQVLGGQNVVPFAYNQSSQTTEVPVAYNTWDLYGTDSLGYKYVRIVSSQLAFSEIRVYAHPVKSPAPNKNIQQIDIETGIAVGKTIIAPSAWSDAVKQPVPFTKDSKYWNNRWAQGVLKIQKGDEGFTINTSNVAIFRAAVFGDETIKMKLRFDENLIIGFRATDGTNLLRQQANYQLVFDKGIVQLARGDQYGNRVLLLGEESDVVGKLGTKVVIDENLFKQQQLVEIESKNLSNGVKISLRIGGKQILECVDNLEGYLTQSGFLIFKPEGNGSFVIDDVK